MAENDARWRTLRRIVLRHKGTQALGRLDEIAVFDRPLSVEEIAARDPRAILHVSITPAAGIWPFQARALTSGLGLTGRAASAYHDVVRRLLTLFRELDCSLLEINPLAVTKAGLIRRFENPKTQAALDLGIAEMNPDDSVGVIVHHIYDSSGSAMNETKATIVVRLGNQFSVAAAGFKDWTKPGFGVEGKLVWKPRL